MTGQQLRFLPEVRQHAAACTCTVVTSSAASSGNMHAVAAS